MIIPSADRLEERVGSKYALVILSAKRARQLKEGLPPLRARQLRQSADHRSRRSGRGQSRRAAAG